MRLLEILDRSLAAKRAMREMARAARRYERMAKLEDIIERALRSLPDDDVMERIERFAGKECPSFHERRDAKYILSKYRRLVEILAEAGPGRADLSPEGRESDPLS